MRVCYTSEVRRRSVVSRRSFSAELSYLFFTVLLGLQFGLCRPDDAGNGCDSLYEYAGEGPPQPGLPGISGEGQQISVCSTYLQSQESVGVDTTVSMGGATVSFTELDTRERGAPEAQKFRVQGGGSETRTLSEPSCQQRVACASTVKVAAGFVGVSWRVSEVLFEHEQRMVACGLVGLEGYGTGLVLAGRGSR